jgi:hypothetical protein
MRARSTPLLLVAVAALGCAVPAGSSTDESGAPRAGKADGFAFQRELTPQPIDLDGSTHTGGFRSDHYEAYTFSLEQRSRVELNVTWGLVEQYYNFKDSILDELAFDCVYFFECNGTRPYFASLAVFEKNEPVNGSRDPAEIWHLRQQGRESMSLVLPGRDEEHTGEYLVLVLTYPDLYDTDAIYHFDATKKEESQNLEAVDVDIDLFVASERDSRPASGVRVSLGTEAAVVPPPDAITEGDPRRGMVSFKLQPGTYVVKLGPDGEGRPLRSSEITVRPNEPRLRSWFQISRADYAELRQSP